MLHVARRFRYPRGLWGARGYRDADQTRQDFVFFHFFSFWTCAVGWIAQSRCIDEPQAEKRKLRTVCFVVVRGLCEPRYLGTGWSA